MSSYRAKRLGTVASTRTSNVDKKTVEGERPVLLCNYVDVYKNDSITSALNFMKVTASVGQIAVFGLRLGDTVITKDSETADDIGIPAYVAEDVPHLVCGYHLAVIRPDQSQVLPRFIYWVLRAEESAQQWEVLATGVTRVGLRKSDIGKLTIPVPPISRQRVIANFLDRETAQIDELIAKQNALIELLGERRKAVITQAVTKGLDRSLQMKDSGVEWLGDVPTEWPVGRISYFSKVDLGKMVQPTASSPLDFLAPYMRAANVQPDGVVDLSNVNQMWFRLGELKSLGLDAGDVVVVEGGIGGYGRSAYLLESLPGWGYQNSINRIRMHSGHDGRYLNYVLLMSRFVGFIAAYCTGVSMPHLTAEKLVRIVVPAPPKGVQVQIADFLDEATQRIDNLVQKANRTMDLLRERRSALITAAVTGKIDVRGAA